MKKNTKLIGRKILLILFPVLFLGFCALAVFSLNGPRVFNNTYPKDFAPKEMTEMKKGETRNSKSPKTDISFPSANRASVS